MLESMEREDFNHEMHICFSIDHETEKHWMEKSELLRMLSEIRYSFLSSMCFQPRAGDYCI
jgi:hypothetical protein